MNEAVREGSVYAALKQSPEFRAGDIQRFGWGSPGGAGKTGQRKMHHPVGSLLGLGSERICDQPAPRAPPGGGPTPLASAKNQTSAELGRNPVPASLPVSFPYVPSETSQSCGSKE